MSDEASRTFERARHGLKMFLDNRRDISAYEAYFAAIEAAHRERFVGRVAPTFREFAYDLGVTTYQDKLVGTTHGVAFATGLEPSAVLDQGMGLRLERLWYEAGQSFAMAALAVDGPAPAIAGTWRGDQFGYKDYESRSYYASVFAGSEHPNLNAVLLHYLGMINSAHLLFPLAFDLESDEYTLFKIRYVLTSHVLGSLKKLTRDGRPLPAASREHLRHLVHEAPAAASSDRPWLRNLLVHYEPNPRTDLSKFDRNRLLNGIVAMSEVPESVDIVVEQTNRNLTHLADGLNAWMLAPAVGK